jgi:hypothetical protein
MDDDPYGFCPDLERSAVKAFDKAGLTAFARVARERFEQSCADPANYLRQPWGGAWQAILAQQGSVQKYLELVEKTELTASDGETIAGMFQAKRRLDEALAWTERGLHLERRSSRFRRRGPQAGRDETRSAGEIGPPGRGAGLGLVRVSSASGPLHL